MFIKMIFMIRNTDANDEANNADDAIQLFYVVSHFMMMLMMMMVMMMMMMIMMMTMTMVMSMIVMMEETTAKKVAVLHS